MKGIITMNITKKIMSTISALIIATSVLPISGMAITYDKDCSSLEADNIKIYHCDTNLPSVFSNEIDTIVNSYLHQFSEYRAEIIGTADAIISTENFIELSSIDTEEAVDLLDYNLELLMSSYNEISTYGLSNGVYYSNYTVPYVAQSESTNCGIAAILEAAIGNGALSNTSSNKNSSKQTEVKNSIKEQYVTYTRQAYQIVYGANLYSGNIYNNAICVTSYNINSVMNYLRDSLRNGVVPIVNLNDTAYLEYYNNSSYAHYVVISQINDLNGTVTIVDPFNSSVCGGSSSFGGTHTVTYDELLGAIRNNSDSWIIVGG